MISWLTKVDMDLGWWQFQPPHEYLELPDYWPNDSFTSWPVTDEASAFWSKYFDLEELNALSDCQPVTLKANKLSAIAGDLLEARASEMDTLASIKYNDTLFTIRVNDSDSVPESGVLAANILNSVNKHYQKSLYKSGINYILDDLKDDKSIKNLYMAAMLAFKWSMKAFYQIYLKRGSGIQIEDDKDEQLTQ